jgi:hypothetical protein
MQTDSYTKVVLTLILLCLVVLLVHGFSGAPGSAEATGEGLDAAGGHYEIRIVQQRRGRPTLLRWDTTTGQVWGMKNLMGKDSYWELLDREGPPEEEPPLEDLEEPAEAPAAEEDEAVAEEGEAAAAGGGEADAGEAGGAR